MIRLLLICVTGILLASPVRGEELRLYSQEVFNGEVALVRWLGEPLSFGVIRFRDRSIDLYPFDGGAVALIPVGLDVAPGHYPLAAALVDRQGVTTEVQLTLTVVHKDRPEESLTLPERMVSPGVEDTARIAREAALLEQAFALRSLRHWESFQRPVDDPVSSVFGKRRLLNGKPKSPHSGTDFRSPQGTPVRAISSGRVALAGDFFYTGLTVVVDHGEGLFSLYAHLSKLLVAEGTMLNAGDFIGHVGSTGRSTGAHLHLTVRLLGERIDPLALLALFTP